MVTDLFSPTASSTGAREPNQHASPPRAERQLELRRSCLAAEGSLLPQLEMLLLASVRGVVTGGAPHACHWVRDHGTGPWSWPMFLSRAVAGQPAQP